MENLATTPVTATHIKDWTNHDPVLAKVKQFVASGWPERNAEKDLQPYFQRQNEITIEEGCLLWGSRVIIPPQGRIQVVEELHEAHPGIVKMKGLARSFVWWPGIDVELEQKVKSYLECQSSKKLPIVAPLHPWEWPDRPWSRIHIDYAGPFMGRMFLVVDAHSKWLEVLPTSQAMSTVTIEKLRCIFATFGLPEIIVSDNGTAFTSKEFQEFTQANGIVHIKTAPYHPASKQLG